VHEKCGLRNITIILVEQYAHFKTFFL
jgi:hypothetical protein